MKRILALAISMVLLLSIALTGCGGGGSNNAAGTTAAAPAEKILVVNNGSEPGSLHPGKATGTHDSWVLEHTLEGLTKKSPDGNIVAGMAAELPKASADGLTYTIKLRDAKWTNGDPVTAGDFEYAWKYCLAPATASEYAYQMYYLKGGEAYNTSSETDPAKLKALEDAVGVKALDDKTLQVTLEQPTPYFVELLSFYTYYPVPSKVQAANENWYTEAATYVSNGAFKLAEWNHKESVKIVKNPDYYDAASIKLDGIEFVMLEDSTSAWQMYQNDEIHLLYPIPTEVTNQLRTAKSPELKIGADLSIYYYGMNTTKKPFNNVKVRKALAMAIDRTAIVENVTMGGQLPAFSMVPAGIPDTTGDFRKNGGDYFKEDVEEAKKLLAEGLKEEGVNTLNFTLTYNTSDAHKKIAEAIQEMWRKNLGIEVKLENVEFQVKLDRERVLDYEMSRSGWIGDYVDPMTFLDMWTSFSQQNNTGWKNDQYDAFIRSAMVEQDPAKRLVALHDAEKLLMENIPVIPIYFYTKPYTVKPYVTGVFEVVNRYPQLHYADIAAQ